MAEHLRSREVALQCPVCGKTGVASVIAEGIGVVGTASAADGFYVRLAPDNSLSIACTRCGVTIYEAV